MSAVELGRGRDELANVKSDLENSEKAPDTQLELTVLKSPSMRTDVAFCSS
jgi:hypothetical protein